MSLHRVLAQKRFASVSKNHASLLSFTRHASECRMGSDILLANKSY